MGIFADRLSPSASLGHDGCMAWWRRHRVQRDDNSGAPGGRLEYFCYISRGKVDQLYEQVDPEAEYEVTELRSTTTSTSGKVDTNWGVPQVITLFKAGGSYGRTGVIQREAKVKVSYLRKLERVMLALAAGSPIPDLAELQRAQAPASGSGYFHFSGTFRVVSRVTPQTDSFVTVAADLGRGRRLLLDCSLRNFSEGPLPDGSFDINSANMRFFEEEIGLRMTTVFLLLDASSERVVGTPLFLKLALPAHDTMTAL